jgi:hypothetical protein
MMPLISYGQDFGAVWSPRSVDISEKVKHTNAVRVREGSEM